MKSTLVALVLVFPLTLFAIDNVDQVQGQCDVLDINSCTSQGAGQFCFLNVSNETTSCAVPFSPAQQNETCTFLNGCEGGLGCTLVNPMDTGLTCAHICDPGTGITTKGGTCSEVPQLSGGDPVCAPFNEFYSDVSLTIGMCVDCQDYPDRIACDKIFGSGFETR